MFHSLQHLIWALRSKSKKQKMCSLKLCDQCNRPACLGNDHLCAGLIEPLPKLPLVKSHLDVLNVLRTMKTKEIIVADENVWRVFIRKWVIDKYHHMIFSYHLKNYYHSNFPVWIPQQENIWDVEMGCRLFLDSIYFSVKLELNKSHCSVFQRPPILI